MTDPDETTQVIPSSLLTQHLQINPSVHLSRPVAAEVGMYAGAALILLALVSVVSRSWADWTAGPRWAVPLLLVTALCAGGLYLRLPWSRPVSERRRRAISVILSCGLSLGHVLLGVAMSVGQAGDQVPSGVHAAAGVGVLALVNVAARSPFSETVLLGSVVWSAWVLAPPGPTVGAVLVGLGLAWAMLGFRYARGPRTALAIGSMLVLVGATVLASGQWAWPSRGVLLVICALGLLQFLRGGSAAWLALGAGAAMASGAAVAGEVVGPALALAVGGAATMLVSWVALRGSEPGGKERDGSRWSSSHPPG